MRTVEMKTKPSLMDSVFEIDKEECTGCGDCITRCSPGAISIVRVSIPEIGKMKKKAQVDPDLCTSCGFCLMECLEGAVSAAPRSEPLNFELEPPSELEKTQVEELCKKANLHPEECICNCSFIRADKVALAVVRGAKTTSELILKTGVRASGCTLHCSGPAQRILRAHGVEIDDEYQIKTLLWDIPDEVAHKYAEFRVAEDKEAFKDGIITDTMNKVFLGEPYENT